MSNNSEIGAGKLNTQVGAKAYERRDQRRVVLVGRLSVRLSVRESLVPGLPPRLAVGPVASPIRGFLQPGP